MTNRTGPGRVTLCCLLAAGVSCAGRPIRFLERALPANSSVAILIDAPDKVRNLVLARFRSRGFAAKAVTPADFHPEDDMLDIRDLRKASSGGRDENFLPLEKSYHKMYKLYFYNNELGKAEYLAGMKKRLNVQYLILLELKPAAGVSWGRAIDLRTNDLIWLDNRPGGGPEETVDGFIDSMTGKENR